VFYLLFLLAYAFTVPITFLTVHVLAVSVVERSGWLAVALRLGDSNWCEQIHLFMYAAPHPNNTSANTSEEARKGCKHHCIVKEGMPLAAEAAPNEHRAVLSSLVNTHHGW
jgi:hypothetical protein